MPTQSDFHFVVTKLDSMLSSLGFDMLCNIIAEELVGKDQPLHLQVAT